MASLQLLLAGLLGLLLGAGPPATVVPVPSAEDRAAAAGWGTGTWLDQHEAINRASATHRADLVFLGDSITQSWGGPGRTVGAPAQATWDAFYGSVAALNFGISGDRTQHVLWRIDHGNFDGIDPRAVVLLIGTNNLRDDDAEDIARGIAAIVERLETKAPSAVVLVCSIVRGATPQDRLRRKATRVNELVRPLAGKPRVRFVDLTTRFYDADGRASAALLRDDFVHFAPAGYRAWAEALRPHLAELLPPARPGPSETERP